MTICIIVIVVLVAVIVKMVIDSRKQSQEIQAITERLRRSEGALNDAVKKNTSTK